MKFTADTKTFREAFGRACSAVPSRTPKEVLKNVKVVATQGRLTLIGSSEDVSIEVQCEADISDAGDCLLPGARVKDWLAKVTGDTVTVSVVDDKAFLACGAAKVTLPTEPVDTFPPVGEFESSGELTCDSAEFAAAIRRTMFAADVQSVRYALGGVNVEWSENAPTLTATDSRRLATVCMSGGTTSDKASAVFPVKALTIALSFLGDSETTDIDIGINQAAILCGSSAVTFRLVEGRFPRWRDVMPKHSCNAVINAGTLAAAISQAMVVSNEETRGLEFEFTSDALILFGRGVGETSVEVPLSVSEKPVKLELDGRYVAEGLRAISPESSVNVHVGKPDEPVLFDCGDWRYVVMPLSRDA